MTAKFIDQENFSKHYPPSRITEFWDRIEMSLGHVFGLTSQEATKIVEQYRLSVESASIGEQMLTFRESPLQIAATLAGLTSVTEQQTDAYDALPGNFSSSADEPHRHLNLQKLSETALNTEPFEYLIVPGFLSAESVHAINATYPNIDKGGSYPIESLDAGMAIKDVIDELDGPEFEAAIAAKFGVELTGKPKMYSLRGYTRPKDGQIHTDSKDKIITVLLYLNEDWQQPGGRLRILRNGSDVDDYAAEVPPDNGTLLVFKRSDKSWHGHHPFDGQRRSLQMNWMTSEGAKGFHAIRHKISATFKKLTAA